MNTHVAPGVFPAVCASYGLPAPVAEHRFHATRKWRFDWAWPGQRVALEVQGGIFCRGRHTQGAALLKEWEKLNTAASLGWRILYCQPKELLTAATMELIRNALAPAEVAGQKLVPPLRNPK